MGEWNEEEVKADYCAGILTYRQIVEKHGIPKTTLIDLAKKRGWVRKKKPAKSAKNTPTKPTKPTKIPTKKTDQNGSEREEKYTQSNDERNSLCDGENGSADVDVNGFNPNEFGLSEQQAIFAQHIATGKTRVDAYRLSGYVAEGNSAYVNASRLLRNAKVARAVRFLRDQRQERYAADLDEIVNQLVAIAHADPNELAQHRRVNCRYCWGENNFYQWRDIEEFDKASEKAAKDGKAVPEYGGLGFVDNSDPNPDCPKCNGEGRGQVFIADTRDLDGPARWLYAGVKETKFGIEVQTANQEAARRSLIQLLSARAGGGGDNKLQTVSYTPEDYQRAAQQLDDEFGDLD